MSYKFLDQKNVKINDQVFKIETDKEVAQLVQDIYLNKIKLSRSDKDELLKKLKEK